VSATFLSRWQVSENWRINARIEPSALLIWGIDSEFADFTRRSYDFGSGLGLRARGMLSTGNTRIVDLFYNLFWQHTLNGAAGDHVMHFLGLTAQTPRLLGTFTVGATGFVTVRNSYYRDYPDVFRRFPEVRAFATWSWD
jgi:hypothetical protein